MSYKKYLQKIITQVYTTLSTVITSAIITVMQSAITKYIIHKINFYTGRLYINDYTKDEFESTWEIICLQKSDGTMINPATPLDKINDDIVYTLNDNFNFVYFPIFAKEINFLNENNERISVYDVLMMRIRSQISDMEMDIDAKYDKLFGKDYQYFLPYYTENGFKESLDNMYKVKVIY